MESDEEYLFMNDYDPRFDYKLMYQHLKNTEPVEYKGVNYIIQGQNIDKAFTARLLEKMKEWDWYEVDDKPMTWTTEDFKSVALAINAEAQFRGDNEG